MLQLLFESGAAPKEGDVYKELLIHNKAFTIRYGYYEEYERLSQFNDPIPIYPDFRESPVYTDEGIPFATAMQDICPHFLGKPDCDSESCMDCQHFHKYDDMIGLCNCPNTKKPATEKISQGGNEK